MTSRIAFVSGNELHVMNADGSGQLRLAQARPAAPAWSPDGARIAFVTNPVNVGAEIYVVGADGSEERNLTEHAGKDGAPAWSPDGRTLAFQRWLGSHPEIYLMSADGSGQRNLTRHPTGDVHPAWSPDGRKIAFVRRISFTAPRRVGGPPGFRVAYRSYLHVVNADGSGLRRLTRDPVYSDLSPDWSPDGRTIRFGRYLANADGSRLKRLTRSVPMNGAWSPDGRKVSFQCTFPRGSHGTPRANYEVCVMNSDGSGYRRLTRSPGGDGNPAWSGDGTRIAFVSHRDGNAELYVMNADGSAQRRLTRSVEHERWFAWSPWQAR